MVHILSLALLLIHLLPLSARAEEPAQEAPIEAEELHTGEALPVHPLHHPKVVPSLHAGVAFRFDFEEEKPAEEIFLVVGGGVTAHLNERLAFVPLLTFASDPRGTWGFGANAELEIEIVDDHLAVDVLISLYQETNIHERHTEMVFAHGLGLTAILNRGVTLTVGGQAGMDLGHKDFWKQAFYPYVDIGVPIQF